MRRYVAPVALAALGLALGGCSSDDPAEPDASSTSTSTSTSPVAEPSQPTASTELLDWQQVPGPTTATVTRSGDWTLTVSGNRARATLSGPDGETGYRMTGRRVSDALIDGNHAVVVLQDRAEQRPSVAEVTDLESGRTFTLDGSSDVPTTTGGTWALGADRLLHATVTGSGGYCLATVDLASQESERGWCAGRRQGFNGAQVTNAGTTMLTFKGEPSCRTPVSVDDDQVTPLPSVTKCKGWDSALFDGGVIWTTLPKEREAETAAVHVRDADGTVDLGPASTGTLVWCGSAAYFARDPQRSGAPATLMRWAPGDGLTVAYRSPPGQAFLDRPRCGGDAITLTALAESGDEQVSAPVT